mgnify:CR=1 FL=1
MEYIFNLDKNNIKGDGIFMKKIIMLVILAMTTFSCSLLDNEAYQEMKRDRAERGVECYEKYNGNVYCKDRDGNRY